MNAPDALRERLAGVLAEHDDYGFVGGRPGTFMCDCGTDLMVSSYPDEAHRLHVADALLPVLADVRAEAARESSDVVHRVVDLWNRGDGWIPGAAYKELAEALGVDASELIGGERNV